MKINYAYSNDSRGTSEVIGVVLLVAVTVVLSAVMATFVLGFEDEIRGPPPHVVLDSEYNSANNTLIVNHKGGEAVDSENLIVENRDKNLRKSFDSGKFVSGDSVEIVADKGDEIAVFWEADDESMSIILYEAEA